MNPNQFGATYQAFLNAIHPDDREAVNRVYKESLIDRKPYEITHRLLMSDGRVKWVHERCKTDFDADGKPLLSQGTVQDITERKLVEDSLRKLSLAVKQSPNSIMKPILRQLVIATRRSLGGIQGFYSPVKRLIKPMPICGRHCCGARLGKASLSIDVKMAANT